ncbi:MAG TPA: hypothetical protein PKD59_15840 [Miltoncostaeaceae bacterium]|nr:hypothetical protein [Miltoncostaeaceae bacterium]
MRSPSSTHGQLILFPGIAEAPAPAPAARRRRPTRVERKVLELERIAEAAEREMADGFRRGDAVSAKAAHDRARGARRAAEILRAGPGGVAGVLGGHHEAA